MASRHQGKTEEQTLIENIKLNRQVIADICAEIPHPGKIPKQWRDQLTASPIKMSSLALLAGMLMAAFLRDPIKKRTYSPTAPKIISILLDRLIHNKDQQQKAKSTPSGLFPQHLLNTIWQILK